MKLWTRNRISNAKGMTLIEVMVAFIILGIVSSSIGLWFIFNHQTLTRAEAQNQAVLTAQRIVDSLQVRGLAAVPIDTLSFNCGQANQRQMSCTTFVTGQELSDTTYKVYVTKKIRVGIGWNVGGTAQRTSVEGLLQ